MTSINTNVRGAGAAPTPTYSKADFNLTSLNAMTIQSLQELIMSLQNDIEGKTDTIKLLHDSLKNKTAQLQTAMQAVQNHLSNSPPGPKNEKDTAGQQALDNWKVQGDDLQKVVDNLMADMGEINTEIKDTTNEIEGLLGKIDNVKADINRRLNDNATNSNDKSRLTEDQKQIDDKSKQYKEALRLLVTQSNQTSETLEKGQEQVKIKADELSEQRPELATFASHFSGQAPVNPQGKALTQA
jgi:chromosome segregation ATPase